MLLLDIDDFKAINDRFGHVEADVLLHDIGARLRDALPGSVVSGGSAATNSRRSSTRRTIRRASPFARRAR